MRQLALFGIVFLVLNRDGFADGGAVQIHAVTGRFAVTLFTEPPQPRAGQVDFSVLIQDAKSGHPILDAAVTASFTPVQVHQLGQPAWYPPSCAVEPPADLARVPLLHSGASDRLLYGALVEIPAPGTWHALVKVDRGDEHETVEGNLEVATPLPPVANYWPLFLFPVVVIGLYVLRAHIQRASTPSAPSTPSTAGNA